MIVTFEKKEELILRAIEQIDGTYDVTNRTQQKLAGTLNALFTNTVESDDFKATYEKLDPIVKKHADAVIILIQSAKAQSEVEFISYTAVPPNTLFGVGD